MERAGIAWPLRPHVHAKKTSTRLHIARCLLAVVCFGCPSDGRRLSSAIVTRAGLSPAVRALPACTQRVQSTSVTTLCAIGLCLTYWPISRVGFRLSDLAACYMRGTLVAVSATGSEAGCRLPRCRCRPGTDDDVALSVSQRALGGDDASTLSSLPIPRCRRGKPVGVRLFVT